MMSICLTESIHCAGRRSSNTHLAPKPYDLSPCMLLKLKPGVVDQGTGEEVMCRFFYQEMKMEQTVGGYIEKDAFYVPEFLHTAVSNRATKSKLLRSAQGNIWSTMKSANPRSRLTLHKMLGKPVQDNVPFGLR